MKILPKLIEKLKKANTIEEKKQIFLDAGLELDDKELNQISSGASITAGSWSSLVIENLGPLGAETELHIPLEADIVRQHINPTSADGTPGAGTKIIIK